MSPTRVCVDDDEQQIADLEKAFRRLRARLATTSVRGSHDEFTAAATPAVTYALTYIPVDGTCLMALNGLVQEEGVDYSVDATGIVTVAATQVSGDHLTFRYLITDWLVARSLVPETDLTFSLIRGTSPAAITGGTTLSGPTSTAPALTPDAGDLLIVIVDWEVSTAGAAANLTLSGDTFGGLTWTRVQTSRINSFYNPNSLTSAIFYARAVGGTTGTPGSYVTVTGDIAANRALLNLFHATGVNATTPVRQSASTYVDGPTPASITPTLASAPLLGNLVFVHLGVREGVGTVLDVPSGYTNPWVSPGFVREALQSGPIGIEQWVAWNAATTDPAPVWNVSTAANIDSITANIIEIAV